MSTNVYIADSDHLVANSIAFLLRSENISSRVFTLGSELLASIDANTPACIVVESHLPDMSATRLLHHLRINAIDIPVILLSNTRDIASSVDAMKDGAWDYLIKPFMQQQLVNSVKSAISRELAAV